MEEDIKNMSKEELLEYLEDISQQLDNIALDQIQFAISELQFFKEEYKKLEEENAMLKKAHNISEKVTVEDITQVMNKSLEDFKKEFIPTSVIEKKIEELKNSIEFYQNFPEDYMAEISINVLQEILEEGRNT